MLIVFSYTFLILSNLNNWINGNWEVLVYPVLNGIGNGTVAFIAYRQDENDPYHSFNKMRVFTLST